jgi:hypothetical protein
MQCREILRGRWIEEYFASIDGCVFIVQIRWDNRFYWVGKAQEYSSVKKAFEGGKGAQITGVNESNKQQTEWIEKVKKRVAAKIFIKYPANGKRQCRKPKNSNLSVQ